jgi:hypothetical protein
MSNVNAKSGEPPRTAAGVNGRPKTSGHQRRPENFFRNRLRGDTARWWFEHTFNDTMAPRGGRYTIIDRATAPGSSTGLSSFLGRTGLATQRVQTKGDTPIPIAARRAWRRAADGLSRPLAAKRRRARAGFDGTVAAGPAQSLRAASRDTGDSSSGVLEICSGKTVPFEIAEMSIHSLADDTSHFRSTGTPPLRIEPDHPCLHDQTPRPKAACGIPLPPSLPALLRKRGNDLRTPAAGIEAACSPSLTAAHRSRSRTYPAGKVKG